MFCYFCVFGVPVYHLTHEEFFVPAGHVGLLMNENNEYLFAEPGMHNIRSCFIKKKGIKALRGHISHGNRTIVIIEQGYIGYAMDNGQPVLLPPGIHVWTSESLYFERSVALDDHKIPLGPYTLVTVDEGYAAVTQDNGKQMVLDGGHTHLLTHKNWKFEKYITLKIQTDDLQKIEATSADNINMSVDSTVNWRIVDVEVAATMAAETMAATGQGEVAADISKLRRDVLKQALASLAAFIGSVNYSESFHMSAAAAHGRGTQAAANHHSVSSNVTSGMIVDDPDSEPSAAVAPPPPAVYVDNPLYDMAKMGTAVEHANTVTRTYGIEILSINIISASPVDDALTKSLASGAVASAEALMMETAARGQANAVRIGANAEAERSTIEAQGTADSDIIRAKGNAQAAEVEAEGAKKAEMLRADGEASGIEAIAKSISTTGGQNAMAQRIAELYVTQLGDMAKHSNMMIVPDRPNDVSGVVATALSIAQSITASSASVGQ